MKKLFSLLICLMAVACSKPNIDKIIFDESDPVSMLVDGRRHLNYRVFPEKYQNAELQWSTSNPEIAEAIEGYVFAKKEGSCVITASAGKASASINLDIKNLYVTKATFSASTLEVPVGRTAKLEVTSITPSYANATNIRFDINPADRQYFEVVSKEEMTVVIECKEGTPNGKTVTLYCSGAGDNALGDIKLVAANRPLTGIGISGASTLRVGNTVELMAELSPNNTTSDVNLTWAVANQGIAKIEANGSSCKLTGVAEGSTKVTLTETISNKSASLDITVKKARDYSKLSLGLYAKCTKNEDGTYSVSGKDEFPSTILPGAKNVEMYLGLSDGMALTDDDYGLGEISVTYGGKASLKQPYPDGGLEGTPYYVQMRINELGETGSVSVTTPAGKTASRSFKTAISSISIEVRAAGKEYTGFQSNTKTIAVNGTYYINNTSNLYITFCINSGDGINTWDIDTPNKLMFGSCSASAAYYEISSPNLPPMEKSKYEYNVYSAVSVGWKTFEMTDYPSITWVVKVGTNY